MNDTCQRGVGCGGQDAVFQGAGFVDGSCKNRIADGFLYRQAFPCDGRLVDGGIPGSYLAIETDSFARSYPDQCAYGDGFNVNFKPCAIDLLHRGALRRQIHQAAYGIARPIQRLRFDQLGDRKEEHDHGRFWPLSNQHRTGHRDTHQRIDVQVTVLQRDPALFIGRQAAQQNGEQRHASHSPIWRKLGKVDHFRRYGGHAR